MKKEKIGVWGLILDITGTLVLALSMVGDPNSGVGGGVNGPDYSYAIVNQFYSKLGFFRLGCG